MLFLFLWSLGSPLAVINIKLGMFHSVILISLIYFYLILCNCCQLVFLPSFAMITFEEYLRRKVMKDREKKVIIKWQKSSLPSFYVFSFNFWNFCREPSFPPSQRCAYHSFTRSTFHHPLPFLSEYYHCLEAYWELSWWQGVKEGEACLPGQSAILESWGLLCGWVSLLVWQEDEML